ncbi:MAG: hypothetical protein GWP06_18015, partial [Actinobacteria bacterium]|nr:hypothetical protein [Actinomycetota bacterium]
MEKNHALAYQCIVLCFFLLASICLATETRMGSMGGVGFYARDNSNVFYFPGTIFRYSNQVVTELRAKNIDSRYTAGAHVPLDENTILGIYLNRPLNMPGLATDNTKVDRTTNIIFGTKALGGMSMALGLSIGMDKYSEETGSAETKESAMYLAFSGGVSNEKMDVGFLFEIPSAKWELEKKSEKWGGVGIGFNARYFISQSEKLQIVPLVTFYLQPTSYKYDSGISGTSNDEVNYSQLNLGLGLGLNYHFNEKNLVVLAVEGIGISQNSRNQKEGDKTVDRLTTLPGLYMGVESQINKWFTGRLGAAQVFQSMHH